MRVFDVGMYDGSDTRYYLDCGHQVLAIEANPALCLDASEKLKDYIRAGQLQVLNVAVSETRKEVNLTISGRDLGASSIYADRIAHHQSLGTYRVGAASFKDILAQYGPADFIKIDIEGADRECVMALTADTAPRYLSFEASENIHDQLRHLGDIGYRKFKFIQQMNFRSLDRQHMLRDRIIRHVFKTLGYSAPRYLKRHGHFFKVEHSAGPPPWESDGAWLTLERALRQWDTTRRWSWYDVHVKR